MPSTAYRLPGRSTIGVLASGGLDSSILVGHLLDKGERVQPFYIRFDSTWQEAELASLKTLLAAFDSHRLLPLVMLDMPITDLYGDHWSTTGRDVPGSDTPDEAVYLPGRNLLLIVKAAVWCQLHGIDRLALAPLESNPFADATPAFFSEFEAVLNRAEATGLRLLRPFAELSKRQVMQMGLKYPLHLTFSCINPRGELHCGACNKCAERRQAFRLADVIDGTRYLEDGLRRPSPMDVRGWHGPSSASL